MLYKLIKLSLFATSLTLLNSVQAIDNNGVFNSYKQLLVQGNIKTKNQSLCYTNNRQDYFYGKNQKQNPASVTKLFMTYWAIKKLGAFHRFETKLYQQDNNIFLKSSGDPYLLSQQLLLLVSKLNDSGVQGFDTLYVNKKIMLDWNQSRNYIKRKLLILFNPKLWDESIYKLLNENEMTHLWLLKKSSSISVKKVVFSDGIAGNDDPIIVLKSPFIFRSLKEVNKYSNNFYFDQLLKYLGGVRDFNDFISKNLKMNPKDFYFYTASGLGENYLKCEHILALFKEMMKMIKQSQITLNQLLPVLGIDRGTMHNRMEPWPGSSWAKSGSLPEQGHLALAGITKRSAGYEFFVFLNRTKKFSRVREIQDSTLENIYHSLGDIILIDYEINELNIVKESQVL